MARIVFDDSRSIADMLHSKENRRTSFAVFNKMIEEGAFWVSETITQNKKDFQEIQMQLSQKQMNGEELSDEEVQKAHDLADKVGNVDEIKALMGKERNLNQLMNDLNQIITKPVQELYND